MKLYMHPVSTVSRPVSLFIAEKKLPVEQEVVDLMTGAHHQEPFTSINPNRLVPVLEDGDFRLTVAIVNVEVVAEQTTRLHTEELEAKLCRARIHLC